MNNVDKNIQSIPKLLRSMACSKQALESKQDIILVEAASLIEHLARIREKAKQLVAEQSNE